MKSIVFMLVALVGASASGQEMQTGWAWAGIASVTLGRSPAPAPSPVPVPKPGDQCKPCNGTGRVGDGRVSQTCRDCNGTGKVIGIPVSVVQQQAAEIYLELKPIQVQECSVGVCPLPPTKSQFYQPPQQQTVRRGWIFK